MFEKGIDLVVQGPCKIKVKQGKIDIAGIEVNGELTIKENKTFTITSLAESEIETDCKVIGKFPSLNWREKAEEVYGKTVIIGEEDSGKSYFSNMISNIHNLPILDSDVGQSSLFIPTFISLSDTNKKTLSPREKGYKELEFFGDKTPSWNPRLHIELISKLSSYFNDIVIDTDGWVRGFYAYRHKIELIHIIDPDFIVVFDDYKDKYLPLDLRKKVIKLKKLPINLNKNRSERAAYRRNLYKEYFKASYEIKIDPAKLFGEPISDKLFMSWGEILQLSDETPCEGYFIELEDAKGLLVGLTLKGKIIGAGIISNITKDSISIKTPEKQADGVLLSNINLNENFEERRVKIKKCSE